MRGWIDRRGARPPLAVIAEPDSVVYQASLAAGLTVSKPLIRFGLGMLTLLLVNVTWVFFRAPDFAAAARILLAMFGMMPTGEPLLATVDIVTVGMVSGGLVGAHWLMRDTSLVRVAARVPWWLLGLVWATMLVLLVLTQKSSSSFIYFQF